MEGGQVAKLLPQDEEEGIEEVHKLGQEVPPGHVQSRQTSVAERV